MQKAQRITVEEYEKLTEESLRASSHTVSPSAEQIITEGLPKESLIIRANDLIELEIPEPKYILSPWIAEQTISLIVGRRGEGKTWFAMGIANAITMGYPKFGPWETITPVPCLYVDGELSLHGIQQRLKLLGHDKNKEVNPLFIYSSARLNGMGLPSINLYESPQRESIKHICMEEGVKVLFLDNIASLCPGMDENTKKDWDPINQWLLTLRFNGISTIMLHHTNKNGEQRGTSGREDNIDNSITLAHPKDYEVEDGIRFEVRFTKNRLDYKHLSEILDIEMKGHKVDNLILFQDQNIYQNKKTLIQIRLNDGVKVNDIMAELGVSESYVHRVKRGV